MKQFDRVAIGSFQFLKREVVDKVFVADYEGVIDFVAPDGSIRFTDGVFVSVTGRVVVPLPEEKEKKA